MKPTCIPITVSLTPNLDETFERLAQAEAKTKSQLFREMLTSYDQWRKEERVPEL